MASAEQSIAGAEAKLRVAYLGLQDMQATPSRFDAGLMNAVVFGRMVTLALQNMRSDVPEWEAWYAPWQEEMRKDPQMRFFIELRNSIEKTTAQAASMTLHVKSFSKADIKALGPPPPGAVGFAVGEASLGGASGWIIQQPDGSEDVYAVDLPSSVATATMHFINAPGNLGTHDVRPVVREYLGKLKKLVDAAKKRFL